MGSSTAPLDVDIEYPMLSFVSILATVCGWSTATVKCFDTTGTEIASHRTTDRREDAGAEMDYKGPAARQQFITR